LSTKFCAEQNPAISRSTKPTKFDLIINLTTAKTHGVGFPNRSCCARTK
jgi:hypothetical protein